MDSLAYSPNSSNSTRYREARFITLMGAVKNALLSIAKISFGIMGYSHALLADGVHSLTDLVVDGVVIVASRLGSKEADAEHPYGHRRIETMGIIFVAIILVLAGIGIFWNALITILYHHSLVSPHRSVLYISLASILLNEISYYWTQKIGKKINSAILKANAWHHRLDSVTSLVVIIGILGTWAGIRFLDAVAAIVVALMIFKMAINFAWNSIKELIDTAIDPKIRREITALIQNIPGVLALHDLRTRSAGIQIFCDVHILVNPRISVSEGHYIGQQVHYTLIEKIPRIKDVVVHVDPEDDTISQPSRFLPNRLEIENTVKENCKDWLTEKSISQTELHYLEGKVYLYIGLPLMWAHDIEKQLLVKNSLEGKNKIDRVFFFYE